MIVGDLVKYKENVEGFRDKGVFLVIAVEIDETFGELITLKQGNEQRLAHPNHLDKISSSR